MKNMVGFSGGEQPVVKKNEVQFRQEAAGVHTETVEKMNEIEFELEVKELTEFGEQVAGEIIELEKEVEDFCLGEAEACGRAPQEQPVN
jgi:hypothetical protein